MSDLTSSQLLAATVLHPPGIAESMSQPIADNFRHRQFAAPRVLTQGDRPAGLPMALEASQTSAGLREQVFSEAQARMLDVGIDISDMDSRLFSFMLPVRPVPIPDRIFETARIAVLY